MNGTDVNEITQPTMKNEKKSSINVPSADGVDGSHVGHEFMRISSIESDKGHHHKIENCKPFSSSQDRLLPEDQITEIQDQNTTSLSHDDLVDYLNKHVYNLYFEQTAIKIKINRQTNGITEILTFNITIEVSQLEEDGDKCQSLIARLSCVTLQYPYDRKIKRTVRLSTCLGKFLKQHKKTSERTLLVEPIDDHRSTKYNFESVEYLIGPLDDKHFRYLFCLRVKIADSWLYVCPKITGGLQLSKMDEIKDRNFEVTCDGRFCFRNECGGDSFFSTRIDNKYFLAFNVVDNLHFKSVKHLPWSEEAMKNGKSDEFRFTLIDISCDSETQQ